MAKELDSIDRRILDELQENGRLSIVELAARINLTKTPCSERVKRLEATGVIRGYRAEIDPDSVGMSQVTVVHVSLSRTQGGTLREFDAAARAIPEIQTCLLIAGSFDYMLKVRTRDMAHFRELHGERISQLPHVLQTHSFAVMDTIRETGVIRMSGTAR